MTTAAGRLASNARSGNSAMAMPLPMVAGHLGHQALQQRTTSFGTSWPCASPPSSFLAALSHGGIPPSHALSISPTVQALRGNLVIAHGAGPAAASSTASVNPTTVIQRRNRIHAIVGSTEAPKRTAAYPASHSAVTSGRSIATAATDGTVGPCPPAAAASCRSPLGDSGGNDYGSGSIGVSHRSPAPTRVRVKAAAVTNASVPPASSARSPTRPPSPSFGMFMNYFDGFCPEGATECSPVWEQLRWCSKWQQLRQVYDNLLRAEALAVMPAMTVEMAAESSAGGDSSAARVDGSHSGNGSSSGSASISVDRLALGASSSSSSSSSSSASSLGCVPGLLSRDETYAFLLQLQDFYHIQLDQRELEELQAFRCRLVRDLSVYVRHLNAEQLEALCCASAVSGKCLARERADAVQQRLLKILSIGHGHSSGHGYSDGNGNGNGNGKVASGSDSHRRHRRSGAAGGFQVLTPALNTIFALYDHGYLPHVDLLQAVFRQAVDHCGEVTRSQWHGLYGLARRFRFLLDDLWLEDLHAHLREPLSCTATDFGRMASILGCISAFTVNKAMEALDTRVLVVVEAIERRYDEGLSLLTAHQLLVFTALLVDMQSPFRAKWLGHCLDHLGSCRSHLAGLPPATLVLAVELVLRGRGWDDQRLLGQLLRQLFATYVQHPTAALRKASSSNVIGCPPRAASRIISSSPSSSSSYTPTSLSAMAAAAAWDVDVGCGGGAAFPALDLASLVDWLASKVPLEPGPQRSDTLEFLKPMVSVLVEEGRPQLASLEPRCLPGVIRSVAMLGVSPSRQWVAEAFARVASGAAALSGSELVAMLRLSHAQGLPLPHVTLDAVCSQYTRFLPLMRAVDLSRLLECWVADRYIPSCEQLEGFFDAVCHAFDIDPAALKVEAAGGGGGGGGRGALLMPGGLMSFDDDTPSLPSSRRMQESSYMEFEMLQAAGGAVSAGAADGVAGSFPVQRKTSLQSPKSAAAAPVAKAAGGPAAGDCEQLTPAAAATATGTFTAATASPLPPPSRAVAPVSSTTVSSVTTAATIAVDTVTATADLTKSRFLAMPSLGSLDGRPKGSLLQPAEAQSMLSLLDQYRALLLKAKRSDLLVVTNTYRNAVTAALHKMTKSNGAARKSSSSQLLQAVLCGGGGDGSGGSGSGSGGGPAAAGRAASSRGTGQY